MKQEARGHYKNSWLRNRQNEFARHKEKGQLLQQVAFFFIA